MRTISELAERFSLEVFGDASLELSAVALNTSSVTAGSLFIAVQGATSHGLEYLEKAISFGAIAVLSDKREQLSITNLYHPDPRKIAGAIANEVYGTLDSNMQLYAVTGTNGKTSTIFYLSELLNALGQDTGLISSAYSRVGTLRVPADLTTPEAPRIHQLLSEMRSQHQFSAAIEASAQGLTRSRLDSLHFKVAGFTNLSRDHLDDYQDMDNYLAAKAKLFSPEFADKAVVMLEDAYSRSLYEAIEIPKVAIGREYHYSFESSELAIGGKFQLRATLNLSALMVKNLVLAIVMLLEDGYQPDKIERALEVISTAVPGRLQRVSAREPAVFVDYAHTPAAIEAGARELAKQFGELTVILAASGDRDSGKREAMAQAAKTYATRVVVTDQHPRSEDPATIRAQLLAGLGDFEAVLEVADPADAIGEAVRQTSKSGAVLWCGPGHLNYREVKGEKIPFDAISLSRKALGDD